MKRAGSPASRDTIIRFAAYAEIVPAIIRRIGEPGLPIQRPIPREYPARAVPAE